MQIKRKTERPYALLHRYCFDMICIFKICEYNTYGKNESERKKKCTQEPPKKGVRMYVCMDVMYQTKVRVVANMIGLKESLERRERGTAPQNQDGHG